MHTRFERKQRQLIVITTLVEHLRSLIREHPTAKQGEHAEWIGVSHSRISQLKKLL
nr:hypothetical protein [Paenibacillus polymyxa]